MPHINRPKSAAPSQAANARDSDDDASGTAVASRKGSVPLDGAADNAVAAPRRATKIATVSHTLDSEIAERLRHFAFHERMSESAVIEYALREFFALDDAAALGQRLRESGAALRRKT